MKRIVSGITPSGDAGLHIGNYLGAVKQFKEMARENECFLFVADLHALTTIQDKTRLEKNIQTLILHELSLLGDLKNITFFRQSDVSEHTELSVILSNFTPLGLIKRAHAYKDKLEKEVVEDDINMGLFCYPILMAADILLYKPDLVPVGKDQKQHVEITRDIAERFNKTYGKTIRQEDGKTMKTDIFKLPEPFIPEHVATVLGTDGKRKMSKSLGNIISIFEDEEVIKKQVMGCYTDPLRKHADDPGHIEGNMVFTYLDFFGNPKKVEELKSLYVVGKVADVEVKKYLFESLMNYFAPARARYQELKANPKLVKEILEKGTVRAREVASMTMQEVHETLGLVNRYSISKTVRPAVAKALADKQEDNKTVRSENGFITIDEFSKVELRVGKVEQAENVEKSEKLIRLHVSFGAFGDRIVFTGVRGYGYTPEDFTGKQFFFVTNLLYRKMLGEESQGMIVAVDSPRVDSPRLGEVGEQSRVEAGGKPIFVSAEGLPVGSMIR
jgi:tryptophanyl-tRNA synthetase